MTRKEKFRACWEHYRVGHHTGVEGVRRDRRLVCVTCGTRWYL